LVGWEKDKFSDEEDESFWMEIDWKAWMIITLLPTIRKEITKKCVLYVFFRSFWRRRKWVEKWKKLVLWEIYYIDKSKELVCCENGVSNELVSLLVRLIIETIDVILKKNEEIEKRFIVQAAWEKARSNFETKHKSKIKNLEPEARSYFEEIEGIQQLNGIFPVVQ
jgi:hypothetical protein